MKNQLLLLLLLCVCIASCESTEGPDDKQSTTLGDRIFVLNQGGYNATNASLSVYNWTKDTLINDLISPLGDVGNDLQYINGKLYAALDNSAKIEVINPDSTAEHHSIDFAVNSAPAKIVQISATEAMVPQLNVGKIAIINLQSDAITETIDVDAGQYSIGVLNGTAYSASLSGNIIAIDPVTKKIKLSHWINPNPSQVVVDSSRGKLLFVTAGDYVSIPAKIYWINPVTLVPTDSIVFGMGVGINQLMIGKDDAYIFFFKLKTKAIQLSTHLQYEDGMITKSYYGGFYDRFHDRLYLGLSDDFQHNDAVDIFDLGKRTLLKSITTGISPAFFAIVP